MLAEVDSKGSVTAYYTIGDDLLSQERDGKVSVYLYDGHGSVVGLADENGAVTDTYTYDAFGNPLKSTGTTANNYRYCGEQFDETTGLYYLRARYMDTSTGRFISQDSYAGSISDPVSLHKYLYCGSDPVNCVDPSGYSEMAETEVKIFCQAILNQISTINLTSVVKDIIVITDVVLINIIVRLLNDYFTNNVLKSIADGTVDSEEANEEIKYEAQESGGSSGGSPQNEPPHNKLKEWAEKVAKKFGVEVKQTKKGNGYSIKIILKAKKTGNIELTVRFMSEGSGSRLDMYVRISHSKIGGLDLYGNPCSDRALGHTTLSDEVIEILIDTITQLLEGKWN